MKRSFCFASFVSERISLKFGEYVMKMKLIVLLGTLLLILGSACCFGKEAPNLEKSVRNQKIAVENEKKLLKTKGSSVMKIALCHLEVSCGPQESNLKKIEQALRIANERGAKLVVTPETAVQGYYFHRIDEARKLEVQPASYLNALREVIKQYGMYLMLGCGEYVEETGLHHNSCLVFAPDGNLQSRHRKIYGEKLGSEKWASPGDKMSTTNCDGVNVGVLVCADSWFDERPLSLKEQGADILIDIAAWPETPETGKPLPSWQKVTKITGLPFAVCNQTGKTKWMDMSIGESVVIQDEVVKCIYSGEEAVLFFEFDTGSKQILSEKFEVVKLKD